MIAVVIRTSIADDISHVLEKILVFPRETSYSAHGPEV
jgi:hypothetical protein